MYTEYFRTPQGTDYGKRKKLMLCTVRKPDGSTTTKREAQRLLQPHVDRVNSNIATPQQEQKTIALHSFLDIWKRDNLSTRKRSTQSAMASHLSRIRNHFGDVDLRSIDSFQGFIKSLIDAQLDPKTIRNFWVTTRLIWKAAKAQQFIDSIPEKPELPRKARKQARHFSISEVAQILHHSEGQHRLFYRMLAETGVRVGELCGLRRSDVVGDAIEIRQAVWGGQIQEPKTNNSLRDIALSKELLQLVNAQIKAQKEKGHDLLFTTDSGLPWDANNVRQRHLHPLLERLGIQQMGFHAFRHFNASALSGLGVPEKITSARHGRLTGNLTLDVYIHSDMPQNRSAASKLGIAIEEAIAKQAAKAELLYPNSYSTEKAPGSDHGSLSLSA